MGIPKMKGMVSIGYVMQAEDTEALDLTKY
jgi:hypothetical protein